MTVMPMPNMSKVADLYLSDRETYDGAVAPMLSDDQIAEVLAIVDGRVVDAALERVGKSLVPDADADLARLLISDAARMGEDVLALAKPQPGKGDGRETDPWWTHAVTVPTSYGSVKIQVRSTAHVAAR